VSTGCGLCEVLSVNKCLKHGNHCGLNCRDLVFFYNSKHQDLILCLMTLSVMCDAVPFFWGGGGCTLEKF